MILKKILKGNRNRQQKRVSFIDHTIYAPAAQRTPTIFPGAANPIYHNLPEDLCGLGGDLLFRRESELY